VIALARGPDVWTPHVNHADDARVFELIWNDADVHAWVICWSEDRAPDFTTLTSPIAVISGEACEERLRSSA
jgi:hypothetical protein